jgi:DEAD/DEAH box helicase domain-containing protein
VTKLQRLLEEFRVTGDLVTNVTAWRVLQPRPSQYGHIPGALDPRIVEMLARQGIHDLYTHQADALEQVFAGRHAVIVTPTASGKTLCYNLPVLNSLLSDHRARALYLFPTKALAYDQQHILQGQMNMLAERLSSATYDGDTPTQRRPHIRATAHVVLSNPDMLHTGILPAHARWQDFFAHLRFVVLDEMHQYRGIFGTHVANVLRRLRRICRFYGSQPQFICCSATIANPRDLAERLLGDSVSMVTDNGAPQGERNMVFYNPPLVNQEWGLRRSALQEARTIANRLLNHSVQTVVFARSRLSVELLVNMLRQDADSAGRDPLAIRGYRSGYLASERREIERGLRCGDVRCVVATNALELGVDIGSLAACIMAGYAGTIASTWQQAGRAGRGTEASVAFLIASSSPSDQYIISHPDYFFGQSPEHALLNPDNLHVLTGHIQCAASELPFQSSEAFGGENLADILSFLSEGGTLRESRGRWFWAGPADPARTISLRTADPNAITIVARSEGEKHTIGQIDRPSAPLFLHEGAIYWHEGQQYLVESLDWESGMAYVRAVTADYYTEASQNTRIDIQHTTDETHTPQFGLAQGEVLITTRVSSYRKLRLGSLEHLGWGQVDLPEQQMLTAACWLTVSESLVERLRDEGWWVGEHVESRGPTWPRQRDRARARDHYRCRWCGAPERPGRSHDVHHIVPFREFGWRSGENSNDEQANQLSNLLTLCASCHRRAEQQVAVQSTLAGLGRVLGHLIPLRLMCDVADVGISADVQAPQTGVPTIFFYDRVPAGIGLSIEVAGLCYRLLDGAARLIHDCPCTMGCPSCIGTSATPNPKAKQQVLRLISALQETPTFQAP